MAVHRIPASEFLQIGTLTLYANRSADAEIAFPPDLAGGTEMDIDDIVIVDEDTRTLYKGLVVSTNHNITAESVGPRLIGLADIIDSVPWEAQRRFYNVKDLPCVNIDSNELTVQDFFDTENVSGALLETWFTSVVLENSVGTLLLPEIDTYNKGFFTILKEMLAPYPQLRWVLEFDGTEDVFPAGVLRVYDAAQGLADVQISLGGEEGVVTDYNVNKDASECAQNVRVYSYGKFTDRLETLQPSWPTQSIIRREFVGVSSPVDPGDSCRIQYEDDDFFLNLKLYADNALWQDSPTSGFGGGIFGDRKQMKLWPGGDIAYNVRTGEIRFLTPEDESDEGQWWWVHDETGEVYPHDYFEKAGPDGGVPINLTPGLIRRPFAYKNNHTDQETYIHAHYDTLAPEAFREYAATHPVADFRLREVNAEHPTDAGITYAFTKEDDAIDIFRPKSALDRETENSDDLEAVDYGSFNEALFPNGSTEYIGPPGPSNLISAFKAPLDEPMKVYRRSGNVIGSNNDGVEGVSIYMKRPFPIDTVGDNISSANFNSTLRFWEESEGGVSYEEGTNCIKLAQRQLSAIPEWNDKPNKVYQEVGLGVSAPVVTGTEDTDRHIKLVSWAVMARYTSWEDLYEERTTPIGRERYAKLMMRSALQYLDGIVLDRTVSEPEPRVVFDNVSEPSGPFQQMVDMAEEYYGEVDWKGQVSVDIDRGTNTWVIPYRVGQRVTFTGEVSPEIAQFDGIINKIDLSRIDQGIATLHFGKQVPVRSPFASNKRLGVQPEIEGFEGTDPEAPAAERL